MTDIQNRLIGEMAGALMVCLILLPDEDINKECLKNILKRYEEEFNRE